ncbi:MAG: hypothetical protein ACK56F_01425, partial [bacterium]
MYHVPQPQLTSGNRYNRSRAADSNGSPELLWEVIFLKTEDHISQGTNSTRFQKSRERIFETLKETGQPTSSSYILNTTGFKFEILASLDACIQHPERPLAYTASLCTTIHHIPEALFATDVLLT